MNVNHTKLYADLNEIIRVAIYDAVRGLPKKTGAELVSIMGSIRHDLRNGDPNWLMRIYSAAYQMTKTHCMEKESPCSPPS